MNKIGKKDGKHNQSVIWANFRAYTIHIHLKEFQGEVKKVQTKEEKRAYQLGKHT